MRSRLQTTIATYPKLTPVLNPAVPGCLIGRLLPLYLLSHLGLNSAGSPVTFQTDSHGRPSLVSRPSHILPCHRSELTRPHSASRQAQPILDPPMDYNISHDGDWVVMGWSHGVGAAVGVDVMRLGLPNGIKNADELVEALEEQVSTTSSKILRLSGNLIPKLTSSWSLACYSSPHMSDAPSRRPLLRIGRSISSAFGCTRKRSPSCLGLDPPKTLRRCLSTLPHGMYRQLAVRW